MRVVLATVAILGAIVLIRRGERAVEIKHVDTIPPAIVIKTEQECA
jgi:hypothetical protein